MTERKVLAWALIIAGIAGVVWVLSGLFMNHIFSTPILFVLGLIGYTALLYLGLNTLRRS